MACFLRQLQLCLGFYGAGCHRFFELLVVKLRGHQSRRCAQGLSDGRSVKGLSGLLCRGIIEHNISEVARGARRKEDVLDEAVQHFRGDYMAAAQKQGWPARLLRLL